MIVSGTFLEGVDPAEYAAFMDDGERASIARFAALFPIPAHAHGLELHLGAYAPHADYLVCLKDDPATVRAIAAADRAHAVGSRVWRFLGVWSTRPELRADLPVLWLEYDRPEGTFADPPGLFVALAESRPPGQGLDQALAALCEDPAGRRAHVDSVLDSLPPGARVRHVGAMPSRDPRFLRLVVESLGPDSILDWLDALRWPGAVREVERLVAEAAGIGVAPSLIDLDCLDALQPTLGIEFLLTGAEAPDDGGAHLLDWLVDSEWCAPAKRDALTDWLTWRVRDSEGEALAFWEKLYHIKVTLKQPLAYERAQCAAKAYLGFWSGPKRRSLFELQAAMRALPV